MKLLLERGGMYDRGKEFNLKNFRDIGFVVVMGKVWCFYSWLIRLRVCDGWII